MQVDATQLRARMAALDADALKAIAAAPEGQYTAAAREAAALALSERVETDAEAVRTPPAVAPAPARSAIKSLLALVLAWIGWVMIVVAVMIFLSGQMPFALAGAVLLAAGGGLGFAVRALTPSWYRLFTVVAAAYGVLSLAMVVISMMRSGEASPDQVLRTFVSLAGAMVLAIGGWLTRARRLPHS
jgi:hypothetical protein